MERMKSLLTLFLVLYGFLFSHAQEVCMISCSNSSDSSFYSIAKIDENDFWICGESGILKRIDTLGNLSHMSMPANCGHLLKVLRWKHYVFLSSDNGTLFRYDLIQGRWLTRSFDKFRKRCFYNFFITPEGRMVICGGSKGIAKGKREIPRGFIASCDTGFSGFTVHRSRLHQFVFLVKPSENGGVAALTFNGVYSSVYESKNLHSWRRKAMLKGLVHDFLFYGDTLYMSGSWNMKYKKEGLLGRFQPDKRKQLVKGTGCIWKMFPQSGKLFAISRSGSLATFSTDLKQWNAFRLPEIFSIYALEFLNPGKCIIAGNGKRIYMVNFDSP